MGKIVIYTCITAGYDTLKQPRCLDPDFDFVCFMPKVAAGTYDGVWQLRSLPSVPSSREEAKYLSRYPKFLPHTLLPEYEWSLWMDANIGIEGPELYTIVREKIASGEPFSAVVHPLRDDVYAEAEACIRIGRATREQMEKVCGFLLSEGYPAHAGLTENNLILRRHNDSAVAAAGQEWDSLFKHFPYRDQMLLGYCLREQGIAAGALLPKGLDSRNHPALSYIVHPKRSRKIVRCCKNVVRYVEALRFRMFIRKWQINSR